MAKKFQSLDRNISITNFKNNSDAILYPSQIRIENLNNINEMLIV